MPRLKGEQSLSKKVCHLIHGLSGAGSYLFPTVSSWVENIGGKDCMTLKLRHILEYLTPSFVQSSGVLLKLVIFGKKMTNGAGPKYWQDVDSASLKVKFITNFWLTLNLLRCLPLLEEGATPIAEVQALSSGHNSPHSRHPQFSLVITSCLTIAHMYGNITLVQNQATAYIT